MSKIIGPHFRLLLMLAIVSLSVHVPVYAQTSTATVSGFITDSTGAIVSNASVTYTNQATGIVTKATTNDAGLYRIPGLLAGQYKSSVTAQGFKTEVRNDIDLQIEAQLTLSYALTVGSATDVVEVTTNADVLESSTPTISQVIEGRQVEDTPLNGRNTMNLVALTPGVVAQGGTNGAASNNANGGAFTNANSFNNYSIAGGLSSQAGIFVDGAPTQVFFGNATAYIITQDAVQEFRVESSVVNPQYGRFGGGVISFGTKSGGSKMHGSVYEYFRNTVLNANNFFNNNAGIGRPSFKQNQFGATAGGPIVKNKAFYFASYEGYRLALGVINTGLVPTPAELAGDFTRNGDLATEVFNTVPSSTPGTYTPFVPGGPAYFRQATCGGVVNKFCIGAPVNPGDAVADPTAQYLANQLHFFPTPNLAGNASRNYQANGKANSFSNQETFRVDYNLSARNKLFARFTRFDRTQDPTQFLNNPVGPSAFTSVGATASQYVLGDTVTLTSTSVLDVRLSYLRYFSYLNPANTNVNLAAFDNGDQAQFWNAASHEIRPFFPGIIISNNIPFPYTGTDFAAQQPFNLYTISGTYSKVLGRHSVSIGGEARQAEVYIFNNPFLAGAFIFAGTNTSCVPSAAPTTVTYNDITRPAALKSCGGPPTIPGSGITPVSDFVSGQFTTTPTGFVTTTSADSYSHYAGIFVNDTWSVNPKLTVTLGVRYELPGNNTEKHDNSAILNPQLANPLVLVNTSAYTGRGDLVAHHHLFSPRVGFSYSPKAGTTFRAGYSLSYLPQDSAPSNTPNSNSIATPQTFVPASQLLCAPLGFAAGGAAGCNSPGTTAKTSILQPAGRAGYLANPNEFVGNSIQGRNPFGTYPYLEQWNANVQQAFGGSTVLQLAYLGARGEHLPIASTINLNQLPTTAPIGATSQSLRPYPLYQNVLESAPFVGDSYYQSAQVTVSKRFRSGGTVLGNYSWSKFLSTAESTTGPVESHQQGLIQDYTNLRAERSYLSFDVPHRLVVSYILDLPVGRGRRFLGKAGNPVNTAVSGWNVSGINSIQSGFPLAIVGAPTALSAAFGGGAPRPNIVPGCSLKSGIGLVASAQGAGSTFNRACFISTAYDGASARSLLGNAPRTSGILRTQGVDNWDFSLGKTTQIHDDINLVFRAEAFNVFNRVQFGDPGLTAGSSTFGVPTSQANNPRSFQFSLRANY